MSKTKVGIINVTGYTGVELARLLYQHPEVELTSVTGRSAARKRLGEVFPHLYPQLGERLCGLSSLVSTAILKDYIGDIPGLWLPAALNLEKSGKIDTAFGLLSNGPVVTPASGAKSTGEIVEKLAEELSEFLAEKDIKTRYLHAEIDTLERSEIIRQLRLGVFNVLVGINLLREGLDIPEVGFIGILDADKEGYIDYLNKLLPLVRPGGLVIAHNITPGMADPRYMEAITTNPNLETIVRSGISLTLKKM